MTNDLCFAQLKKYKSNYCLIFVKDEIIVNKVTMAAILPLTTTLEELNLEIFNLHLDGEMVIIQYDCELTTDKLSSIGYRTYPVKKFLSEADTNNQYKILRAYHWLNWHSQSKYCGKCGTLLESRFDTTEKKCAPCKLSFFPRFSPAVMILIQNKDQILLARSPHFRKGIYSAIAGFIEIGESAEQAAHREVKEELGLKITELEYFSTQTWPFPDSFMIAFKAKYLTGEMNLDLNEIEDAAWFNLKDLPELPSKSSIARKLIDSVIS